MKTTLAFAIVLGLVVTLSAAPARGAETPQNGPPASDTPAKDTVSQEEIRQLAARYCAEGVEAYKAGKLRAARSDLRAALTLDPANAAAKSMLEIVERKLGITDHDRLNEKLQARVPAVEFTDASVKEVVNFLAREAQVNIVFDPTALQLLASEADEADQADEPSPDTTKKPEAEIEEAEADELPSLAPPDQAERPAPARTDLITIHLRDVPLGEVLKYVLRFKRLKYIVEDYAILIVPVDWVDQGDLVTEIFRLTTSGAAGRDIYERLTADADLQRPQGY